MVVPYCSIAGNTVGDINSWLQLFLYVYEILTYPFFMCMDNSLFSVCFPVAPVCVYSPMGAVACEDTMKKVKVRRANRFDESIDIYTEFFKPYELTSFDDTFCIAMTNSARWNHTHKHRFIHSKYSNQGSEMTQVSMRKMRDVLCWITTQIPSKCLVWQIYFISDVLDRKMPLVVHIVVMMLMGFLVICVN